MRTRSPRRSDAPSRGRSTRCGDFPRARARCRAHRVRLDRDVHVARDRVRGDDRRRRRRASTSWSRADPAQQVDRRRGRRRSATGAAPATSATRALLRDPTVLRARRAGRRARPRRAARGSRAPARRRTRSSSARSSRRSSVRVPTSSAASGSSSSSEARLGDQRARQRDPLLLTTRERARLRRPRVGETDAVEPLAARVGAPPPAPRHGCAVRTPRSRAPTGAGRGGSSGTRRRRTGARAPRTCPRPGRRRRRRRSRCDHRRAARGPRRARSKVALPGAVRAEHRDRLAVGRVDVHVEIERAELRACTVGVKCHGGHRTSGRGATRAR